MAISLDAFAGSGDAATLNFTVGAGAGRLLLVAAALEDTDVAEPHPTLSAADLGGVALTYLGRQTTVAARVNTIEWWYLFDPAPGAGLITVTWQDTGTVKTLLAAVSLFGVNTLVAPTFHGAGDTDGNNAYSSSIDATEPGQWVIDGSGDAAVTTVPGTQTAGQTKLGDVATSAGGSDNSGHFSYKVAAAAGAQSMGWTLSDVTPRVAHGLVLVTPAPPSTLPQNGGLHLHRGFHVR